MKISKKLVSFMLALAMVVTAMAVQTVPVQANTTAKVKAVKVPNVKKNMVTSYQGDNLTLKTNYKASQLKFKTSDKTVATVSSRGVITAVKKGKAKVTVSLKKNAKVKKVVTVKVSDTCIVSYSDKGGNHVKEVYNSRTQKYTYTVSVNGVDKYYNTDLNVSFRFETTEPRMAATNYTGKVQNYGPGIKYCTFLWVCNSANDPDLVNFEKMTDDDWFKAYKLSTEDRQKSTVERYEDDKYYKYIVATPQNSYTSLMDYAVYFKDKSTGQIYSFTHIASPNEEMNKTHREMMESIQLLN